MAFQIHSTLDTEIHGQKTHLFKTIQDICILLDHEILYMKIRQTHSLPHTTNEANDICLLCLQLIEIRPIEYKLANY